MKNLIACLNCRHLKRGWGGRLHCEMPISRCPKKRVRKWRQELEKGKA